MEEYRMLPLVIALVAGFSGIKLGKIIKKRFPQLWSGPAKVKKVESTSEGFEGADKSSEAQAANNK